jgi:hypothetical protein
MKTLIRTRRRDATVERGACFHPTIGSVTPNRFTTGHPRARPRCSEIESFLSAQQQLGMEVTLLLPAQRQLGMEVTLLLPAQRQLGTKVTLLLPRDIGNCFHYTKQRGLPEYFLSHSPTSFISLYHNPASQFPVTRTHSFLSSSSNLRA